MSNLLRWHNSLILVFLILLCSGIVNAFDFGVSPASLDFSANKRSCEDIEIYTSEEVTVEIKDSWSIKGRSRNMKDYTSEAKDLILEYSKTVNVDEKERIRFCLNSLDIKNKYGLLLLSAVNKSAEVGIWINVENGERIADKGIASSGNLLTGYEIFDNLDALEGKNRLIYWGILVSFVNLIVLAFLVLKLRKINLEKREFEH